MCVLDIFVNMEALEGVVFGGVELRSYSKSTISYKVQPYSIQIARPLVNSRRGQYSRSLWIQIKHDLHQQ